MSRLDFGKRGLHKMGRGQDRKGERTRQKRGKDEKGGEEDTVNSAPTMLLTALSLLLILYIISFSSITTLPSRGIDFPSKPTVTPSSKTQDSECAFQLSQHPSGQCRQVFSLCVWTVLKHVILHIKKLD